MLKSIHSQNQYAFSMSVSIHQWLCKYPSHQNCCHWTARQE